MQTIFGTPITKGDYIVYPTRWGSQVTMRLGFVLEVERGKWARLRAVDVPRPLGGDPGKVSTVVITPACQAIGLAESESEHFWERTIPVWRLIEDPDAPAA